MPLDRFVLIILIVIVAAGLTVAAAVWVAALFNLPAAALSVALPISVIAYVLWRVIADRIGNEEDDFYDRTPR
ncbi:MAG: hypothetical protein AAGF94_05335 [Pseudomonadota bacterium]